MVSPEAKLITFRYVLSLNFSSTMGGWPKDLEWIKTQTYTASGTPRFIVAVDDQVVLNAFGTGRWNSDVLPLIKRLVWQKSQ
jgi:hypothetical protein